VLRYRLYIDESGDHGRCGAEDIGKRYLCLLGCAVETDHYRTRFHPDLEALKQRHFPHSPDEPVIFHRKEIVNANGPFYVLQNAGTREAFDSDLLKFMAEHCFTMIAVVLDKHEHAERYGNAAFHPYHYCLTVILERYVGWLNLMGAVGDVMAEARGKTQDRELREEFTKFHQRGTYYLSASMVQRALTSKEIKIKPKPQNVAGLQVADLLAHPCRLDVLKSRDRTTTQLPSFAASLMDVVEGKYNRRTATGQTRGYGKILL